MAKKYNKIEVKETVITEQEAEDIVEEEVDPKKKGLTSVVSERPTKVKKGLVSRLVTGVIGPEGLPGIGSYVNDEIVKPAIKNIIVDAVTSGINMVMYGDRGGNGSGYNRNYSGRNRYNGGGGYGYGSGYRPSTRYGSNYRERDRDRDRDRDHYDDRPAPAAKRGGVIEYKITDRYDASHVLASLTESADNFDSVSVADYYDLIGVESVFTDNNYGWTIDSIHHASIIPVRGGYVIKFPPVELL